MSMSLTELRASDRVGLPEFTHPISMSRQIFDDLQKAVEDLIAAEEAAAGNRRMLRNPDVVAGRARVAELQAQLDAHTGHVTVRGMRTDAWLEWCNAHPARAGDPMDRLFGLGVCNVADLTATMGDHAVAWNGEPMKPGDWDFIAANAPSGDLSSLARGFVERHVTAVDVPKLLTALSAIQDDATDSNSPSPSA